MKSITPALIEGLELALLSLDREKAASIIRKAAGDGSHFHAASDLVVGALDRIGTGWEKGFYSLSQVYLSGIICEETIDELIPAKSAFRTVQPRMAIGVFEDFHMLGKRIILSVLRAGGYEITDLGNGLNASDLIEFVIENKTEILMLSTLMLPSALRIREVTTALKETPVKIVVGGAPFRFDENLWNEVGAHASGKNPAEALKVINELTGGNQ